MDCIDLLGLNRMWSSLLAASARLVEMKGQGEWDSKSQSYNLNFYLLQLTVLEFTLLPHSLYCIILLLIRNYSHTVDHRGKSVDFPLRGICTKGLQRRIRCMNMYGISWISSTSVQVSGKYYNRSIFVLAEDVDARKSILYRSIIEYLEPRFA